MSGNLYSIFVILFELIIDKYIYKYVLYFSFFIKYSIFLLFGINRVRKKARLKAEIRDKLSMIRKPTWERKNCYKGQTSLAYSY
jgi:hypothetical protein